MEFSDCGSDKENNQEKCDQFKLSSFGDEERNFEAVCKSFNEQNVQNVMDEKDETSFEKIYINNFTSVPENHSTVNNEKNKNTAFDINSKPLNSNKLKSKYKKNSKRLKENLQKKQKVIKEQII
jgi:hypothetical protein